jgi:hypothetical protein
MCKANFAAHVNEKTPRDRSVDDSAWPIIMLRYNECDLMFLLDTLPVMRHKYIYVL